MPLQPEQHAREQIDTLLAQAGWHVCDSNAANIHAARGVAIREFPLPGHGFADYLFHQNLVMEYNHEMAVADGVNVNYDVYRSVSVS